LLQLQKITVLERTRVAAMAQRSARAEELGAGAIVGVAFHVEALSPAVKLGIATGTAVVL
jgi:uncharacterized protein YbjQ (UPF0145 family)